MRELKAVHAFDVYEAYTKTGDDDAAQVYLKSEADKVIAEKDKELRHQKYKRCMAMALWCDSEANYWYDSSKVLQCCRYGHYIRWFNKWSKLAEKFKEAK